MANKKINLSEHTYCLSIISDNCSVLLAVHTSGFRVSLSSHFQSLPHQLGCIHADHHSHHHLSRSQMILLLYPHDSNFTSACTPQPLKVHQTLQVMQHHTELCIFSQRYKTTSRCASDSNICAFHLGMCRG